MKIRLWHINLAIAAFMLTIGVFAVQDADALSAAAYAFLGGINIAAAIDGICRHLREVS